MKKIRKHFLNFYLLAGNTPRFPDPRDFKLAIVDEPSGIRLRVGFLSPALATITIEVRLLVAVGLDVWPSSTNFPFRVPLGHADCVLYHKAAQTVIIISFIIPVVTFPNKFRASLNFAEIKQFRNDT